MATSKEILSSPYILDGVRIHHSTRQKTLAWLRSLLLDPTDNTLFQYCRYSAVGAIAFIADFSTLYVLTRFAGWHYLVSAAIGFLAGLGLNYALSTAWVFNRRRVRSRTSEFGIFAAVGLAGSGLNELGMWLLVGKAGVFYLWAKAMTTVVIYVWNFTARKLLLFR